MAARYWRIHAIDTVAGGPLSLSALHLYASSARADGSATLTSSITPAVGAVASLADTDSATVCTWSRAQYSSSGFYIEWDLGSAVAVDDVQIGSAATQGSFLFRFMLSSSPDGISWTPVSDNDRVVWPGASTIVSVKGAVAFNGALIYGGAYGTSTIADQYGKTVTAAGGAAIAAAHAAMGGNAISLPSDGSYIEFGDEATLELGAGDFDFQAEILMTAYPGLDSGLYKSCLVAKDTIDARSFSLVIDGTASSFTGLTIGLFSSNESAAVVTRSYAFTLNTPYVVRARRIGGVFTMLVDGVVLGPPVADATVMQNTGSGVRFGRSNFSSAYRYQFFGFMRNIIFRVGSAVASDGVLSAAPSAGLAVAVVVPVHVANQIRFRDMEFGGLGRIAGTVKIDVDPLETSDDIPVRRRVRLYRDFDGNLVQQTWSDGATGAYEFVGIDMDTRFSVVSYDHTHMYRAVIADNLAPEIMP